MPFFLFLELKKKFNCSNSDDGLEGRHHRGEHAAAVQIPSPSGAADVPPANTFLVVDVDDHEEDAVLRHHQQAAGAPAAAHGI